MWQDIPACLPKHPLEVAVERVSLLDEVVEFGLVHELVAKQAALAWGIKE